MNYLVKKRRESRIDKLKNKIAISEAGKERNRKLKLKLFDVMNLYGKSKEEKQKVIKDLNESIRNYSNAQRKGR